MMSLTKEERNEIMAQLESQQVSGNFHIVSYNFKKPRMILIYDDGEKCFSEALTQWDTQYRHIELKMALGKHFYCFNF